VCREIAHHRFCGCGANKFLAKIASDWKKPNGCFVITQTKSKILSRCVGGEQVAWRGQVTAVGRFQRPAQMEQAGVG
jgi:hypothetical protein